MQEIIDVGQGREDRRIGESKVGRDIEIRYSSEHRPFISRDAHLLHVRHHWRCWRRSPLLYRLHRVVGLRYPLRRPLSIRCWSIRPWRSLLELVCVVKAGVSALATAEPVPSSSLPYDEPETAEDEERKESHGQEQEPSRFLKRCQYCYCSRPLASKLTAVPHAAPAQPSLG